MRVHTDTLYYISHLFFFFFFLAGEENPHGAESIGLGPGADDMKEFEVHPVGAQLNEKEGGGAAGEEEGQSAEWSEHARWAMTSWFSSDVRFSSFETRKDDGDGYTVNPWGLKFRKWMEEGVW